MHSLCVINTEGDKSHIFISIYSVCKRIIRAIHSHRCMLYLNGVFRHCYPIISEIPKMGINRKHPHKHMNTHSHPHLKTETIDNENKGANFIWYKFLLHIKVKSILCIVHMNANQIYADHKSLRLPIASELCEFVYIVLCRLFIHKQTDLHLHTHTYIYTETRIYRMTTKSFSNLFRIILCFLLLLLLLLVPRSSTRKSNAHYREMWLLLTEQYPIHK